MRSLKSCFFKSSHVKSGKHRNLQQECTKLENKSHQSISRSRTRRSAGWCWKETVAQHISYCFIKKYLVVYGVLKLAGPITKATFYRCCTRSKHSRARYYHTHTVSLYGFSCSKAPVNSPCPSRMTSTDSKLRLGKRCWKCNQPGE